MRKMLLLLILSLQLPVTLIAADGGEKPLLAPLFSDQMVLQSGVENPVWGQAAPGEKITVSLGAFSETVIADKRGKWRVLIPAHKAGYEEYQLSCSASSGAQVVVKGVVFGEVWFAAGQSNMALSVGASSTGREAKKEGVRKNIRFFKIGEMFSAVPRTEFPQDADLKWEVIDNDTVGGKSAVAYYFAATIQKELDVPVGIIQAAVGGTGAQGWTPESYLKKDPAFKPYSGVMDDLKQKYPSFANNPNQQLNQWSDEFLTWFRANKKRQKDQSVHVPERPPVRPKSLPGIYFNGMVSPVAGYGIRGLIWYQGEDNANETDAMHYDGMLRTLVSAWRDQWKTGDFPVMWVQLPEFNHKRNGEYWGLIRDRMRRALDIPNSAMAVTMGWGDPNDLHPKNKKPVGERLAEAGLGLVYGKRDVWMGPLVKGAQKNGQDMVLSFESVGSGLQAQGNELKTFEVSTDGRSWKDVRADIDNNQIVLKDVGDAVAVRYCIKPVCELTLYNKDGFPASPFELSVE